MKYWEKRNGDDLQALGRTEGGDGHTWSWAAQGWVERPLLGLEVHGTFGDWEHLTEERAIALMRDRKA
ncbi:hypothetical protein [Nocardia fluminea]|uniref:hypothetical protein n=1 Tax=Nocardia fluminea TaxID=134984 RepID=UPI0033E1CD15